MRFVVCLVLVGAAMEAVRLPAQREQHYLYLALPGADDLDPNRSVRILVFDITMTIASSGAYPSGRPPVAGRQRP